jgi:hypothetical protein
MKSWSFRNVASIAKKVVGRQIADSLSHNDIVKRSFFRSLSKFALTVREISTDSQGI